MDNIQQMLDQQNQILGVNDRLKALKTHIDRASFKID